MEEQNNLNLEVTEADEFTSSAPKAKKALPKLPVLIGAAVAGVALITVLLILLLGGNKNVEIAFKESAMPQSVFVLGEEIDLSSGVLLVNENGTKVEVAMNADGVTVSGYNKDTLGEQTITITYKDKSLELTVNVVERIQVIDYTADYLVGDEFDLSAGRLKITRNDGSSYTVVLKSDKVTVSGFNSATAGEKSLSVQYASGSETYTATLRVNVHNVDKVTLSRPTKITYNSHDAGVDVAGGIITLSALDGKIKREIPVTTDMIEGFDLSAVNATNTPLAQDVAVKYNDKVVDTYQIVLHYTSVSMFKDHAHVVAGLDWSGEEAPEITEEQGTTALRMMELYLDMSPADQTLLTREETLNMARAAIVYGFDLWGNDILEFSGAFGVEYGEFTLYCESPEDIALAIEGLADTDRPIYTLYEVINGMVTIFGNEENDEEVYVGVYFSNYPTIDPELFEELIDVFEFMLELDEVMDEVGADWRDDVTKYADEIETVFETIVESDFYSYAYSQFIYFVSEWREGNDAFDFLYEYYYQMGDVASIIQISNLRLPQQLEEILAYVYEAMSLVDYMSNPLFTGMYDSSEFIYSYVMAIKLANEVLMGEDEMLITLFYGIPLNSMLGIDAEELYYFTDMFDYIANVDGGYYTLCGALLGVPEFEDLLIKYVDILYKSADVEGYLTSADYAADVEEMFAHYMALTPAQQMSLIQMLNLLAPDYGIPPYAFDTEGDYAEFTAVFFDIVNEVFFGMFETENGKAAYLSLMLATDIYTQRYTVETWLEEFILLMDDVTAKLELIKDTADYDVFVAKFDELYNEYLTIRNDRYDELPDEDEDDSEGGFGVGEGGSDFGSDDEEEEIDIDLGEWEDEFLELYNAVLGIDFAYLFLENQIPYYDLFFSAFERADFVANKILTEAPSEIRHIYLHSDLYYLDELYEMLDPSMIDPTAEKVFWSFDYVINAYRSIYNSLKLSINGFNMYDYYDELELGEFLQKSYDIIWALMWSDEDNVTFDKAKVLDALNFFSQLSVEAKTLFVIYIESDYGMYYDSVDQFIAATYTDEDVIATINALIEVEMNYIVFWNLDDDAEAREYLVDSLAALQDLYDALEGEALEEFEADFGAIYAHYVQIATELLAEYPAV